MSFLPFIPLLGGTATTAGTAATAATAATTAGTAASAWSTAAMIAGTASVVGGTIAQNRAARYNAGAAEKEAEQTEEAGRQAEQQVRTKTAQMIGTQRATYGASGVDPNSGSAAQVEAKTAEIGEADALTTRYNYAQRADALRNQAAMYRSSVTSPWLSGASTALTSMAVSANSNYMRKYAALTPSYFPATKG